jgi:putative ABC transport system permease protein
VGKKPEAFKAELLRSPGVISATAGYGLPGDILAGDGIKVPTKDGEKEFPVNLFVVDYDYIKTMGLQLVAGRAFSKNYPTDFEEGFIINETALKTWDLKHRRKQSAVNFHGISGRPIL